MKFTLRCSVLDDTAGQLSQTFDETKKFRRLAQILLCTRCSCAKTAIDRCKMVGIDNCIPAVTDETMRLKLFRRPTDITPRFEQDSTLADALMRRVNAIEFQPSRGFLKDQWQQKLAPATQLDFTLNPHRNDQFARHMSTQQPN